MRSVCANNAVWRCPWGADVRDLLAAQYGKTTGMQAMRDYCETAYRALAEYVLDAEEPPADGTPAVLTAADGKIVA